MNRLERSYRRWLRAYPMAWRHDLEDECVAVLLHQAEALRRRRGGVGDVVDLVGHGLEEHSEHLLRLLSHRFRGQLVWVWVWFYSSPRSSSRAFGRRSSRSSTSTPTSRSVPDHRRGNLPWLGHCGAPTSRARTPGARPATDRGDHRLRADPWSWAFFTGGGFDPWATRLLSIGLGAPQLGPDFCVRSGLDYEPGSHTKPRPDLT